MYNTICVQYWTTDVVLWHLTRYVKGYTLYQCATKQFFPQRIYHLYLCQWCSVLCHARAVPVCCINYHSVPVLLSCPSSTAAVPVLESALCNKHCKWPLVKNISLPRSDQLRPMCNNTWHIFKCPYQLLTYQQQLTAGGILGDTINGLERFVYLKYCKWRRLYAVCSKLCGVSLCLLLFCVVTALCVVSCKIKKMY